MNHRLHTLLEILKTEPDDAFTLYAIGLEYALTDPQTALHYFNLVIKTHPDYLPAYYQLGKLYSKISEADKAEYFYRTGIEKAILKGDTHTLSELKNALQNLLLGIDDTD